MLSFQGPMYDMADDDEYDKNRRMSLTQAYRRNNDVRQPIGNRRIGMNNGNHPVYKVRKRYYETKSDCFILESFRLSRTLTYRIIISFFFSRMMIITINNNNNSSNTTNNNHVQQQ